MLPILEAHNLVKKFNGFTAVDDVSFAIEEGEMFSLLGPNGAGKTTTIAMLSCLLAPTAGEAVIGGHSVTRDPMAAKKIIGVVPQDIALYEELSALENLHFWGRMYGMGGAALKRRIAEVLEEVGLADKAKQRVKTYSGGMKRRINIAVGLLHRPRLLFMDEPTVGIDPQSRRNILDSVKALNRQGMTVLYTTHYMEEAQELSQRVGIIDHGRLIALGTQQELTQMVGQMDALRLHLPEGQEAGELIAALQALPDMRQVTTADHQIVLIVPDAQEAIPPVFAQADRLGFKIRSVEIEEPNLEAVFLHLTGRALRD
ncbi:MAG: Daunorubicin/doxorubicin resistance ATP-binding protein DrrA [Chloroflexi bacterium ADurb.Bin325]|nr:MAG: Daunorubicin/doxorubicin resistance ATP-binding protein DrrA [Chloroflexi bacterium ADurb.Bin325]